MANSKDGTIIIKVTIETKEQIIKLAEQSRRTVSDYVRCILEDAIINQTKV